MVSYLSGIAAEDSVARAYQQGGREIAFRRWRGKRGEIDLIVRDQDEVIFVEVKKSSDFLRAAEALSKPQIKRLFQTAAEFLTGEPKGDLTPTRFDVALVNGSGEIQIIENALGY
ncbi:YraN family protein [Gelidibacter sp. F2691]|nr:YraN family protein [Gelidibacter sp. F2691]